mmetsp:Transcript_50817/g.94049  ORF Transcript_50817/g.94049 Transcript_50817/m.94049 type:complete len:529 (+) Transcript_50817:59-1645(+)
MHKIAILWALLAISSHGRRMQTLSKRPCEESCKPAGEEALPSQNKDPKASLITKLFVTYAPVVTVNPSYLRACFVAGNGLASTGAHCRVSGRHFNIRLPRSAIGMIYETKGGKRYEIKGVPGSREFVDVEKQRRAVGKRQPSCIKFWRFDVSGGAGSISSPVQAEHQKNSAEAALLYENTVAKWLERAPPGFLWTILGVVIRKTADRQVERAVPNVVQTDPQLQDKLKSILFSVRERFDKIVESTLDGFGQDQGYSQAEISRNLRRIVNPLVVIPEGLVESVRDVFESETVGRIQQAISDVVQLNKSSAAADLGEILKRADADGNGVITLDEAWEFTIGSPINPFFEGVARNWTVLKSGSIAGSAREKWTSLLLAPWVKGLRKYLSQLPKATEPFINGYNRLAAVLAKFSERYSVFTQQQINELLRKLPDGVRENVVQAWVLATSFLPPEADQVQESVKEPVEEEWTEQVKEQVNEQVEDKEVKQVEVLAKEGPPIILAPRSRRGSVFMKLRAWRRLRRRRRNWKRRR